MTRDGLARCWILVSAATAGASVMAVELLGARMLSVVFGGSLAVWAGMISVTLLSLAVGYFLGGCLADRVPRATAMHGLLLLAFVLTALGPYARPALRSCHAMFGLPWGAVAASALVFALPLALFGTVGPFAIRLLSERGRRVGTVAGSIYAVSTLGSVAGTLLAGLWLIPHFGISVSFRLVAAVGAAVSCVGLACSFGWKGLASCVAPLLLLSLRPSSQVGTSYLAPDGERVVVRDIAESPYGQLAVLSKGGYRLLVVGGIVQTGMPEDMGGMAKGRMLLNRYHQELIPYLEGVPARARVLLIGSGGGMTAQLLRQYGMELDCVDLDGRVIQAARKWFSFSGKAVAEDGRVYLETCAKRYDVCVIDTYSGDTFPSQLASLEAFEAARKVLEPSGVLVLNFIGSPGGRAFGSICRTVKEVFPETLAIRSEESDDVQTLTLFASGRKIEFNSGWMDHLGGFKGSDPMALDLARLAVRPALDAAVVLTDDHNPIDFIRADEAIRWRLRTARRIGWETML